MSPVASFRIEKDLLGTLEVPSDAYFGIQTLRAVNNFRLSGVPLAHYPKLVVGLAMVKQAAADGVGALVVPIAFVSEHIETLVELDIEYAELAHEVGCAPYLRAPAVGADADFIAALAQETLTVLQGVTARCGNGTCACDNRFSNPVTERAASAEVA